MPPPSDDAAADLSFKMSKKIAQLTKVIYQLNCRNEDSESMAKGMAERYENEIVAIMADAKEKMAAMREALQSKKNDEKIQQIIREMTKTHQREKDEAAKQFDEFREKVAKNEQLVRQNFEERTANMTREVVAAKEEFSKKLAALRDGSSSSLSSLQQEFDEYKASKTKETDALVKEYNERYKTMLSEQLDAQDQLEKRLNDEWSKKLAALQAQLTGKLGDQSKQLEIEQARGKDLERELAEAKKEILSLQKSNLDLVSDISKYKLKEEQLTNTVQTLSTQLTEGEGTISALKAKCSGLEEKLSGALSKGQQDAAQINELKTTVQKLTSALQNLENEKAILNQRIASLEGDLAGLRQEKDRLGDVDSEVQRLQGLLKAAIEEKNGASALVAELREKVKSLEDQVSKLQRELKDATAAHQAEIDSLRKSHEEKLSRLNSASSDSHAELLKRHAEELSALRKTLESEKESAVRMIENKMTNELQSQNALHQEAMKKAKAEADQRFASENELRLSTTSKLQSEIDALKQQISGNASLSHQELSALQTELATLKKRLADEATLQRQRFDDEHAGRVADVARLEKEIAQLNDRVAHEVKAKESALIIANTVPSLQQRIAELESKHKGSTAEIDLLVAKHQEAMRDMEVRHNEKLQSELAKLRKELTDVAERDRLRAAAEHKSAMDAVQQERNAMEARLKKEIETLTREIEQLKEKLSSLEASTFSSSEMLRAEMDSRKREYERAIQALKADHAEALQSLESGLTAKHSETVAKLSEQHAKVVQDYEAKLMRLGDDARLAAKDIEENYKARIVSLEKRKDEERERTLRELQAAHDAEKKKADEERAAQNNAFEKAKENLNREIVAHVSEIAKLQRSIAGLEAKLSEECASHERDNQKSKVELDEHLLSHKQKISHIEELHRVALATKEAAHQEQLAAQSATAEKEKKLLLAKIKELQKLVADLEYKYANRESRTEDVEKINQLLKETKEKDEALIKAYNDMKFYKLELLNREENFNKMFGRQPAVATAAEAQPVAATSRAVGGGGPSSAPSKMETAQIPPNVKRTKSFAAEK